MKWSNILAIILLIPVLFCSARADVLTGKVVDAETRGVLRDVNLRVVETNQIVTTNKKGEFVIRDLPAGTYHLVASHVTYQQSHVIEVTVPSDKALTVSLHPQPWVLNDVVVTGTRSPHLLKNVPVQTEVVTQRDFQRTGAKTVDEALTSSIGITINEDLSGQGATIRGVEGDRVLVLVDGERAVGRVNGSIDLSQYALTNVEKIEVVKGTGSTLYGSDAMGGVINIITKRPETEATKEARLYADYGSHAQYNPSVEFRYGKENLGLDLGGKLYSTDGFDLDPSTPHTNGQEKIDRWNFNSKLRTRLSDKWSFIGAARGMRENRDWIESEIVELSQTRDTTYAYDDEEINKRYEGSAALEYMSGDEYSMKFRVYGTRYDHNWNKYSGQYWIDTSKTRDGFYEVSYASNYVIGANHVATYGLDYNYQDLKSTELIDEMKSDNTYAGYFQYEYSPIKQLNFLPGIRYEDHSSFGGQVNPSINIMYHPSERLKVRGFVGRGFRAPSIKQQYFIFDHTSAGYVVYGGSVPLPSSIGAGSNFTQLKEENSINSSISAEFSYGTMGLHRLTYFYNHLNDLIDFELVGFTPTYWRGVYVYQNIETAITQGIEWESRVKLMKGVDFSFSYNYLYSRNLETQEKLVNRPDHTFKVFLSGFWEKHGIGATFWADYQSRKLWVPRSNTGGNEGDAQYAPARTRLNVNFFKRFGTSMEAFVRMENLLDETNVTYGYWPGFELVAGFKYDLNLTNKF